VGEYVISNAGARQFVIYWYQAHGRSVASEYMAKIYMVADAMRLNRTDGALVRVITPIDFRRRLPDRKKARRGVRHAACALAAADLSLTERVLKNGREGNASGRWLQTAAARETA
jgi:EpsI family protein